MSLTIRAGKMHELAPVILDYTRMRLKVHPEQGGVVEVAELMLRFREEARAIKKTLHLLENEGYAAPTDFKDVWEIIDQSAEFGQTLIPGQGPGHRQQP